MADKCQCGNPLLPHEVLTCDDCVIDGADEQYDWDDWSDDFDDVEGDDDDFNY